MFSQSPVNELEKNGLERKRKASGQPEDGEINSDNVDPKYTEVEDQDKSTDQPKEEAQKDQANLGGDSEDCESRGQPGQAPGVPGPSSRKGSA